jgi:hypothetical protein
MGREDEMKSTNTPFSTVIIPYISNERGMNEWHNPIIMEICCLHI